MISTSFAAKPPALSRSARYAASAGTWCRPCTVGTPIAWRSMAMVSASSRAGGTLSACAAVVVKPRASRMASGRSGVAFIRRSPREAPDGAAQGVCATSLSRASGAGPRRGLAPDQSAHDAGMPQRVAARLRPHRQAVRLGTDLDLADLAGGGVDRINHVVEAAGQPQRLAVGADVAHVRAAAAGDRPVRHHLARGEVDHRYAALALARPVDLVRAADGDVELAAVAARVQAVGADAGLDEADLLEAVAVDQEHAVGHHVGDIEDLA